MAVSGHCQRLLHRLNDIRMTSSGTSVARRNARCLASSASSWESGDVADTRRVETSCRYAA